jgi:hypothetical protein
MLGFDMVDARAMIGLGLAAAGLIVLCASLSGIDLFPGAQPSRNDRQHPVVALAWSEAHCDSQLRLRPGTPKLQMEDLIELSAAFDEMERRQGHSTACANAGELAAAVAAPAILASSERIAFARTSQSP